MFLREAFIQATVKMIFLRDLNNVLVKWKTGQKIVNEYP